MDTTYASTSGTGEDVPKRPYVSCIKVDGVPILPPLMTDERRAEMRRYRELAMLKEIQLKGKKPSLASVPTNNAPVQRSARAQETENFLRRKNRSPSTSPTPADPVTSTPRVITKPKVQSMFGLGESKKPTSTIALSFEEAKSESTDTTPHIMTATSFNSSDVPEGVLRERKIIFPPTDLDKSQSSDPSGRSSSGLSYDEEEKINVDGESEAEHDSEGSDSGENFASAASSTGTFVIRRSDEKTDIADNKSLVKVKESVISVQARHNLTTSEDEDEENAPPTVLRKPILEEQIFTRRKRPAKFFDDDDCTPKETVTAAVTYLPNSVPNQEMASCSKSKGTTTPVSFSTVPHTNFTSIAKSLTNEFTKVCATLAPGLGTTERVRSTGGSYDVILTNEIPSSAEKANADGKDFDTISNSSDKENINILLEAKNGRKHIRKLSYTLPGPSPALIQATSQSKEKNFIQTLETVPSTPSSVGIQSNQPTPEKVQQNVENLNLVENRSSTAGKSSRTLIKPPAGQEASAPAMFKEVPSKAKASGPGLALTSALANLNLGQGKQAHLERFLGDQDHLEEGQVSFDKENTTETSPLGSGGAGEDHVHSILQRMHEEQTRKLQELAEQHRQQEKLLQEKFESEFKKLKDALLTPSLNLNRKSKASPDSNSIILDSAMNSSVKSPPRPNTAASAATDVSSKIVTSGMSGISFSELTPAQKNGMSAFQAQSVYQFKGDTGSGRSGHGLGATTTELAAVGLSKLQSRMQLMSPSVFRNPMDAKSPLLKGLVFPDPLDKPRPPLRIPPKALDPAMKHKYDRVSASVKGFLTRRLLNTEKVQIIVQTIRDTVDLLMKLYEEAPMISGDNNASSSSSTVKPQDHELHKRLIQQLTGACRSFHDVFFKLNIKERMALIATDREKLKAKAHRLMSSPGKPNISNATLKSIERRMSHRLSPKRDGRKQRVSKAFDPDTYGSMSVKSKPIKSFNISPKRRRTSFWDERNPNSRSSTSLSKPDVNGNNSLKTPLNSGRSLSSLSASASARSLKNSNYQGNQGGGVGGAISSETFIVPSSAPPRSATFTGALSGRRDSTSTTAQSAATSLTVKAISSTNSNSNSARSTQSSNSNSASNMTRSTSGRASFSRKPSWK